MTDLQVLGLVLISLAVGLTLGHALGYARGKDAERRRRAVSISQSIALYGRPRYRRTSDVSRSE